MSTTAGWPRGATLAVALLSFGRQWRKKLSSAGPSRANFKPHFSVVMSPGLRPRKGIMLRRYRSRRDGQNCATLPPTTPASPP